MSEGAPLPRPAPAPVETGCDRGTARNSALGWRGALLVAGIALLAYANTLGHGYFAEDELIFADNPYLHPPFPVLYVFNPHITRHADATNVHYRPIPLLLFRLELDWWGRMPFAHHAVTVACHAAASVLVALVAAAIGLPRGPAIVAGVLFALHPVHTEPVNWIKCRSELLSTGFVLAGVWLFLRQLRGDPRGWRGALLSACALLLLVLGLLSKTTATVFPALCAAALAVWWPRERPLRALTFVAATAAVTAGYLVLDRLVLTHEQAWTGGLEFDDPYRYHWLLLYTMPHYLWLLLVPWKLSYYHPIPAATSAANPLAVAPWLCAAVAGTWLLVVAALIWAWRARRRLPAAAFATAWVFLSLLPVMNLIVIRGRRLAEQRLYLPSAGLCFLAALGLWAVWRRGRRRLAALLLVLLAGAYGARTVNRNLDWRDDWTFWSAEDRMHEDYAEAKAELAKVIGAEGDFERAIPLFREAVRLWPDLPSVNVDLGCALIAAGSAEAGLDVLRETARRFSHKLTPQTWLVRKLIEAGRNEEAIAALEDLVYRAPDEVLSRALLADLLAREGYLGAAVRQYRIVVAQRPEIAVFHLALAKNLLEEGNWVEAEETLRRTLALDRGNGEAMDGLARALRKQGQTAEAAEWLERLLVLEPDHVAGLNTLAWLRATDPQTEVRNGTQAVALAERAVRLTERRNPAVLDTLAAAHAEQGHFGTALNVLYEAKNIIKSVTKEAGLEGLGPLLERHEALLQTDSPIRASE